MSKTDMIETLACMLRHDMKSHLFSNGIKFSSLLFYELILTNGTHNRKAVFGSNGGKFKRLYPKLCSTIVLFFPDFVKGK